MTDPEKFQKSLEALDLQGITVLQGLLAQRALELMAQKPIKSAKLLVPNTAASVV